MNDYVQVQSFDDLPPDEVRRPWVAWLRHHGVDPDDVAVPGQIGRFVRERQIRYLTWCFLAGCEHEHPHRYQVLRVVQLEAVPSPFPVVPD